MTTSTPCGHATDPRDNPETARKTAPRATPAPAPAARRQPKATGCLKALAMLARNPITHTPIPRMHLAPVRPAGTLIVLDRASGDRFSIYTPRFEAQFRAGHRAGLWYARPVNAAGSTPESQGFATAKEAVDALRLGRWRPADPARRTSAATGAALRIHWPKAATPA